MNKEDKNKIYFGHPINTYNKEIETTIEEVIKKEFEWLDILNPNQQIHQEGYQRYKKTRGNGMEYFYQEVLPLCSSGIFLSFPEGTFGAGVAGEYQWLKEQGRPIYTINNKGLITSEGIDTNLILSIEETRDRVYKHDYRGRKK